MGVADVRTPTQARGKRTRQKLVRAAQEEFSAKGYAQTTAASIARRAGVSTGSFYQYFTDKASVLRELALARLKAIGESVLGIMQRPGSKQARIADELRARMEAVVEAVIDYHREDPGLHAVLTERRHADAQLDELAAASERALVDQIADLLRGFGHRRDRTATAFVLFGMVEGAVHAHVLGQPLVDDARFTTALVDAMVQVSLPER